MEMIAVHSSVLESIGYAPDLRFMRVRFKDGSTYDYPNVGPDAYGMLMAAKSKGSYLHGNFRNGTRLADGGPVPDRAPYLVGEQPSSTTTVAGPKEMFTEDSCCSPRLQRADRSKINEWTCPKCGELWRWRLDGGFKLWFPEVAVMVFK